MSKTLRIELELPGDLRMFRFPKGVNRRLHDLLDKQDRGERLSTAERQEAEGLVDLAERLSLLKLKAERAARRDQTRIAKSNQASPEPPSKGRSRKG